MRLFLENEFIKVEVDSFGAEIKSVMRKDNNREYMWYRNRKYWGRTSPVLFPFVGSMKNKSFSWKGNVYPMEQHGFARDMEHSLISWTEEDVWFELKSNEETRKKYPFDFVLSIGYCLNGCMVEVMWKVENPADENLYFSIGAHPAFLCPVHGEHSKIGYRLTFDGVSEIRYHGNNKDTGLAIKEDLVLPLKKGCASITSDFFDRCTYMIEGNQTKKVGIEDIDGKPIVDVLFDAPLFAIWSPERKNAPFLCIEPWFGRSDYEDFEGDLSERDYMQCLEPKGIFKAGYSMVFHRI